MMGLSIKYYLNIMSGNVLASMSPPAAKLARMLTISLISVLKSITAYVQRIFSCDYKIIAN